MILCTDDRDSDCSHDTQLRFPETGSGFIPPASGTQTLLRVTGRAKALEMLLTGRLIGAEETLRIKLVNQVVLRHDLLPTTKMFANRM